jgi:hypothetical protein
MTGHGSSVDMASPRPAPWSRFFGPFSGYRWLLPPSELMNAIRLHFELILVHVRFASLRRLAGIGLATAPINDDRGDFLERLIIFFVSPKGEKNCEE